jgi:1-acyl-sn-glycerol-3-phosphate acyltransferase
MARSEFYKYRVTAALMHSLGAFCVKRRGYPRPTLREGLDLLSQGERVGVFPEGGVARRQYSVMRGGPISHGACFLAMYGQAPIIPIAMVGTHAMNRVVPWLPFHRAPVHVAIGDPIQPGPCPIRLSEKRHRRYELGEQMREQYQLLYQELLALPGVDDNHDLHPGQADDPDLIAFDPDSAAGVTARREARKAQAITGRHRLSPADV